MPHPQFWNYIMTDWKKNVLYSGFTNNLSDRIVEHWVGNEKAFSTAYYAYYLVWFQSTRYVLNAIEMEKEMKDWRREKKEALINGFNPQWKFFNEEVLGNWPPTVAQIDDVRRRRGHDDSWGRWR